MKARNLFSLIFILFVLAQSCVNDTFDTPPVPSLKDLTPTMTIKEFKALSKAGKSVEITDDIIIGGQVISSDQTGNFYKTLYIQDGTGGIPISINATDLYTLYEPGRNVWVHCRGLTLSDNNNFLYLDYNGDRIPDNLYRKFLTRGQKSDVIIPPKALKLYEVTEDDLGTLVAIEEVEFSLKDKSKNYADATRAGNRTVEDCIGNTIIVRTSNYADFADVALPDGNGTIIGVLSRYRNDVQLGIRDTSDVMLNNPSCLGGGSLDKISIKEVRSYFSGSKTNVPAGKKIEAVVISDRASGNIHTRNMVIQDETGGIAVRFTRDHTFNLNEKVEIDVSGLELSEYQGLLQLNNVNTDKVNKQGKGSITPKEVTIGDILGGFESFESTLVHVKKVSFSGAATFGSGPKVTDGTGELVLFTRSQAAFANEKVPTTAETLNAIVTQGGGSKTMQLSLRNLSDINGAGGGGGGGGTAADTLSTMNEDFSSFQDAADINEQGWKSYVVEGERNWRIKTFSGNQYAQATAYKDNAPKMETFLISPPLHLDVPKKIAFQSAKAYWDHDGLTVWFSTDFDGSDVSSATWTQLNCTLAGEADKDHAWIDSGDIDLSSFSGVGYIAFKYVGSSADKQTGTFRIDNVVFGDK